MSVVGGISKLGGCHAVMKRIPVTSDCIAAIGYDRGAHVLKIEFTSGALYHYFEVPASVYRRLLNAASHGTCFNDEIKGVYGYEEIKGPRS